jgi:hypothetical protein
MFIFSFKINLSKNKHRYVLPVRRDKKHDKNLNRRAGVRKGKKDRRSPEIGFFI